MNYYKLTNSDIRLTSHHKIDNGENIDYFDKICVKPWGYEFLSYMSNKIGIWILKINKNFGTSLHTHFKKDTLLLVLNGKIRLETIDDFDYISKGIYCFIPKKKFHGIYAVEDDTIIMEIEIYDHDITYSDKNDLLRLIDKYKRAKIGYESSIKIETDKLKEYNYFKIIPGMKHFAYNNIDSTLIKMNTYNKLNTNDSDILILLDGEIHLDYKIIKEGSVMKSSELKNIELNNQLFLQIKYDNNIYSNKIISSEEELVYVSNKLKNNNKKIILTCGCFDILHVGHIYNLQKSKELGDILIVCISSDEQIKHIKGNHRPINSLDDRIKLFTIIPYVDYIYTYNEDLTNDDELELDKIINIITPDVWTKGSDYTIEQILQKHASLDKIHIIDLIKDKSTTNIVNKIQNKEDNDLVNDIDN